MSHAYALIGRPLDAVLFRGPDGPVTSGMLLAAAGRVAAQLQGAGPVLNLCTQRLPFTISLLAALSRGQPSVLASDRSVAGLAGLRARFTGAAELIDAAAALLPGDKTGPNPVLPAAQLAAIVLTSGSTGVPSAHEKPWGALVERSIAAADRFGWTDEAAPAAMLATVPSQHMYGFETSVLLPLHGALSSWCGPALLPADIRAGLRAMPGPTVLVTTPVHLRAMLEAGGTLGPQHQCTISASAPLDPGMALAAEQQWGAPVLEIFGATEVGSIASRRTAEGEAWLTYPGLTIDAGALVTGPHAIPTALADELQLLDGGRFRLLGRRADVVKLAGKRASLLALTRELAGLDGVEDAAFYAPDDLEHRAAARLVAFAVAPSRRPADLLQELRTRIDPVFLPRRVLQVDRLPRNEVGKLPREALSRLHASCSTAVAS